MAESEEELKSLLMKVKVESEKVGVKLYIQKSKMQTFFFWPCGMACRILVTLRLYIVTLLI